MQQRLLPQRLLGDTANYCFEQRIFHAVLLMIKPSIFLFYITFSIVWLVTNGQHGSLPFFLMLVFYCVVSANLYLSSSDQSNRIVPLQ